MTFTSVLHRNLVHEHPSPTDGTATIVADPSFIDELGPDGLPGTGDEDLHLQVGSPAVDAGDSALVPMAFTRDLDGSPRVVDDPATPDTGLGMPPHVDLGVFERH